MEFYYYSHGQRIGPIDTAKLKELVQQRVIVPDVPVECDGKIYPARKVKGLEFPQDPPELPPVMPEPEPKDEPKDADQPAPGPESAAAGSGGERIIYVQQPSSQNPSSANSRPAPYPVRIVREPRSYVQRRRSERLERASHGIAAIGWLFVVIGAITEALGFVLVIASALADKPVGDNIFRAFPDFLVGAGLIFGGVHPFIIAEIMFYFAALGYKIASDE